MSRGREKESSKKTLLAMVLLPVFIGSIVAIGFFAIFSQNVLRRAMRTNLEQQIASEMSKADDCLDMVFGKYTSILHEFEDDEEMLEPLIRMSGEKEQELEEETYFKQDIRYLCNRNDYIRQITIHLKNGKTLSYNHYFDSWFQKDHVSQGKVSSINQGVSYSFCPEQIQEGGKKTYLFCMEYKIVNPENTKEIMATVVLNVDVRELGKVITGNENSDVYLCTEDGEIIGTTNEKKLGTQLQPADSKEYRTTKRENQTSGFIIYNVYSLRNYQLILKNQRTVWIVMAVISILILLGMLYIVLRPVLQEFRSLSSVMHEMMKGNLGVRLPVVKKDPQEFRQVNEGFNVTAERLDAMLDQVKQAVLDQKNAEISALEAQIDPHFLYNTLDTINWKAIEKEDYEISEMVGNLADILRYSVKNATEEVSVAQEVSWLHKYLELQQVKLGRTVELKLDIQEEAQSCRLHKLLFQPFVENAIKYSFPDHIGECEIRIRIRKIEEQLHIQIEDNGIGSSPEQIKRLNDAQEDFGNHFGITNVRKRLHLYYEDEASMYFESVEGEFLRIHLFIPATSE